MQDVRFDADIEDNKVQASASAEAGRNFGNKLWNATRFVLMNTESFQPGDFEPAELADRWIWSRMEATVRDVTGHLEGYRFADLTRAVYDFVWRDYCDWYLELAKVRLQGDNPQARLVIQRNMVAVLDTALRLLHPIMPFITETLWQALTGGDKGESLMVAAWPESTSDQRDAESESQMQRMQELVTAVRVIRGEMNVPPAKRIELLVSAAGADTAAGLGELEAYIALLCRADSVTIGTELVQPAASASAVTGDIEIFVPLEGLIDFAAERQRLQKEIDKFTGLLKGLDGKLANANFVDKAPAEVVERERQRQGEYRDNLDKLQFSLQRIAD